MLFSEQVVYFLELPGFNIMAIVADPPAELCSCTGPDAVSLDFDTFTGLMLQISSMSRCQV
jgi:hypothetical protein